MPQLTHPGAAAAGGRCWHVATTAAALAARKETPPFAVIGVDHAGVLRSLDFLPCIPGTGVGGFRPEAATWPGGGIELYLDALADAILPAVRAEFGLTADPARTALGGSSFGGIATLHAITSRHKLAGAFSAAVVESPSLWIDNGNYMRTLLAATRAGGVAWPQRIFLAMGMREHSGSRPGSGGLGAAVDAQHACSATMLAAAMGVSGLCVPSADAAPAFCAAPADQLTHSRRAAETSSGCLFCWSPLRATASATGQGACRARCAS